jgi:hypothetical protein
MKHKEFKREIQKKFRDQILGDIIWNWEISGEVGILCYITHITCLF